MTPNGDAPAPDTVQPLRELVRDGRFQEALEWVRAADTEATGRAEVSLLAATAATRLGDFAAGDRMAAQALERFRQRADLDGRMRSLNLIGAIAFEQGRLGDAELAFGESLRAARQTADVAMAARVSNNLASVVHLRGAEEDALERFRSAMLEHQRIGDRRGAAEAYHNLGMAYRQLGAWQLAENAATQAVRHAELVGEAGLIGLVLCGRAELDLDRGDTALARQRIERAAALARSAGDEVGIVEADRLLALTDLQEGKPEPAATRALAAGRRAEELGAALASGECAAVAAIALRQLGRADEAAREYAFARDTFDRLGAARLRERLDRGWNA